MSRIYKLPFSFAVNVEMQFSSYPAYTWSSDDFYQLRDQRLVVQETTQNIDYSNATIFLPISPFEAVPTWVRTMVANRLATSGASWAAAFQRFNGGTYSNQWEIVDMKVFTAGVMPVAGNGLLTVVSQIPGQIISWDATAQLLTDSYWAGYNIPWLYSHYVALGLESIYQSTGDEENSFRNCSRHNIFKREQRGVASVIAHRRVLRYNRFKTDPLSEGDPLHAIASRQDLTAPLPILYGALDAKVTSASLMTPQACCTALAQSGPTTDDQQPFAWTSRPSWIARKPAGQPDVFNFSWQAFNLSSVFPAPASGGSPLDSAVLIVSLAAVGALALAAGLAWWLRRRSIESAGAQDGGFSRLGSASDVENAPGPTSYGSMAVPASTSAAAPYSPFQRA
jgi:hypothetical protein